MSVAKYFKRQVSKKTKPIVINGVAIDYRFIVAYKSDADEVIMLLTGFGSGWEGITETACVLIDKGVNVLLVSLPGYGNSGNPPMEFLDKKRSNFSMEGEYVNMFLMRFMQMHVEKYTIHFVGHSMGATILAEAMSQRNCLAQSLTMIAPANAKKESIFLPLRFVLSGIWMRLSCRQEYKNLYGVLRRQKSCWLYGRWRQRFMEMRILISGKLLHEVIRDINKKICILGEKDIVYPPEVYTSLVCEKKIVVDVFHHNPTIPHARELAEIILQSLRSN